MLLSRRFDVGNQVRLKSRRRADSRRKLTCCKTIRIPPQQQRILRLRLQILHCWASQSRFNCTTPWEEKSKRCGKDSPMVMAIHWRSIRRILRREFIFSGWYAAMKQ